MPVDFKTAKHICNVIRRQIQNSFPELYINFIIHESGGREKAFLKEKKQIATHAAGDSMIDYLSSPESYNVIAKNRSRFVSIARHSNPGFLGFFEKNAYLALCFINYERFDCEENLRSHALHLVWHVIALYRDFLKNYDDGKEGEDPKFIIKKNILTPTLSTQRHYHRNLEADIFSASLQALQGRKDALEILSKQRMIDTMSAETGFFAEKFPFPVCLDTLDFIFKNNVEQYKKSKKPVTAAISITEEIGKTYEDAAIEQWRSFSLPAQEMAWLGHDRTTILGAAIYTGENTYAQSIADMVAERLKIKPEVITALQDYNPFTDQEANVRAHNKQCHELIDTLLSKVHEKSDYNIFLNIARKQNQTLLEKSLMGWCSSALLRAADTIKQSDDTQDLSEVLKKTKKVFKEEVNSIAWDTLVHFSRSIFQHRRNGMDLTLHNLIHIAETSDEFSSINLALKATENATDSSDDGVKTNQVEIDRLNSPKNISDFIGQNAVKQ